MLFDSDILIWILRGNRRAADTLQLITPRRTSLMSYLEIVEGVRDGRELKTFRSLLMDFHIEILALSDVIGQRAATLMEQYSLARGIDAGDAIIAATAIEYNTTLCTANQKHFKAIAGLQVKAFRP